MSIDKYSWQSTHGKKIFAQEWKPEGKCKAVIALVHGLGEHVNRYSHVAEFYNKNNIAVLSFDQEGHGQSEGIRGHEHSYEATADDIQHLLDDAKQKYPGIPVFLYGHSLGGSLVLYFALSRKPKISGLIVTSPGLGLAAPLPPLKMTLAKIMSKLMPSMTMDNGLYLPGLSRDSSVVEAYKIDPLVHPKVSAALGMNLMTKGPWIVEHAKDLDLPLLLMQGTEDKLVNPKTTAEFAAKAPQDLIVYKEWKGYFHELHNEPEKMDVLKFELDWIIKKIK